MCVALDIHPTLSTQVLSASVITGVRWSTAQLVLQNEELGTRVVTHFKGRSIRLINTYFSAILSFGSRLEFRE